MAAPQGTARLRRTLLATAGVVVAVDEAAKVVAVACLEGREPVVLPFGLGRLRIYRNPGGPRGLLDGHTVVVTTASAVVLATLWTAGRTAASRAEAVGFGLLLGGGAGNLVDRIVRSPGPLRGHVVDWLQPWFARNVMNVADLSLQAGAVVVGAAMASAWVRERGAVLLRRT
jgi:signal peptidase II